MFQPYAGFGFGLCVFVWRWRGFVRNRKLRKQNPSTKVGYKICYVDVPLLRQKRTQGGPDKRWSQGLLGRREAIYHERSILVCGLPMWQ